MDAVSAMGVPAQVHRRPLSAVLEVWEGQGEMKRLRDMSPEYLRLMVWLQQRQIQELERRNKTEPLFDSEKPGE